MDPSPSSPDPGEAPSFSGRSCAKWMIGLLLLLVVTAGAVSLKRLGTMGRRLAALQTKVADLKAGLPAPERAPLGRKVDPDGGNAARHYLVLEWVCQPRPTWQAQPPQGVSELLQRGFGYDSHDMPNLQLVRLDSGKRLSPAEVVKANRVLPLLKHVRDGLRAPRCDWEVRLEDGMNMALPNLITYRAAVQLLAYEAHLATSPEAAIQAGIDGLAFARDLRRHPAALMQAIAVACETIAVRSIGRTLGRSWGGKPVPAALCRRLIALEREPPPSLELLLRVETISQELLLAEFSGHPQGRPNADLDQQPVAKLGPKVVALWLWNDPLVAAHEEVVALGRAPRPWRQAAALDRRFADELGGMGQMLLGSWESLLDYPARVAATQGALRLLAAAHLVRLETGAYPTEAAPCAKHLGGKLPLDPFAEGEAPLQLGIVQGELRVWSVGRDGQSEGGALKRDPQPGAKKAPPPIPGALGDDLVITVPASAPPAPPVKAPAAPPPSGR